MRTLPGLETDLCHLSLTFMHNAVFVKTLSSRLPLDKFSSGQGSSNLNVESSDTCKLQVMGRMSENLGFRVGVSNG